MHLERRSKRVGAAIALLALTGLGLRFGLFLPQAWSLGLSTWTAVGNFHSFFSVLANLMVAVAFMAPFPYFRRARVRGAVTLYIALVAVTYELLLRRVWHPTGAEFIASFLLHDAVPIAVVTHWLLFRERGVLRWSHPIAWLGFPLAYLAYALLRGHLTGWWLYPVMDVSVLGYARVGLNASLLIALLLLLGSLMVAWDRRGARQGVTSTAHPTLGDEDTFPDLSRA